jgi:hypothetical protein
MLERLKLRLQNVGRCRQVVVNSGLTASLNLCTLFLCVCFRKKLQVLLITCGGTTKAKNEISL